jgi:hypothetical protein
MQDKIIQTEILLQTLSLKLAKLRHTPDSEEEVAKLVQLRRDVYAGVVVDISGEISKLA